MSESFLFSMPLYITPPIQFDTKAEILEKVLFQMQKQRVPSIKIIRTEISAPGYNHVLRITPSIGAPIYALLGAENWTKKLQDDYDAYPHRPLLEYRLFGKLPENYRHPEITNFIRKIDIAYRDSVFSCWVSRLELDKLTESYSNREIFEFFAKNWVNVFTGKLRLTFSNSESR